MTKLIKNVAFRMQLKGNGVVNFDGDEQKWILKRYCGVSLNGKNDNYKFAKKEFYDLPKEEQSENKTMGYRLKISPDCLKHQIFGELYNPSIVYTDPILAHYTFNKSRLLQGWLWTNAGLSERTLVKRGALSISSAIETSGAKPVLEVQTQDIPKEKVGDSSSTALYYRENVGNTTYEVTGFIDYKKLQFLSADPFFGRLAVDPTWLEGDNCLMDKTFENIYGYIPYKKGWYRSSETFSFVSPYLAEYGVKFDKEFVSMLMKDLLKRMLNLNISRSTGYAATSKLEIKISEDLGGFNTDEGWIELTEEVIDSLSLDDLYDFYDEISAEVATETRTEINKNFEFAQNKKAEKKSKKNKNTQTSETEE